MSVIKLVMVHNPTYDVFFFLSVLICVVCGLWNVPIPHNETLRQLFIVATIRDDFFLLNSLLAGRTYPFLLADFYDASQFEMINLAIVKIEHFYSDPVIFLFENMQITSIYGK